MKIKKQMKKTISKLVEMSFKDGRMLEAQVTRSIKSLKTLPRYEVIQALSEYLKGLKRKEREHTMYIKSVAPLSPAQFKKVKEIVERRTKITKVSVNIDPEILGGFKLRIGDQIWDESVLGKIQQVKEAIQR